MVERRTFWDAEDMRWLRTRERVFEKKLSQAKRAGGVEISTWAHPDSEPETLPATIDRGGPGAMIGGPIRQVHSPMNSKNTARWPSR